ncbi:MAG: hypothetical protein ABIH41_00135, partial [Nanoarchaeota archaeon]
MSDANAPVDYYKLPGDKLLEHAKKIRDNASMGLEAKVLEAGKIINAWESDQTHTGRYLAIVNPSGDSRKTLDKIAGDLHKAREAAIKTNADKLIDAQSTDNFFDQMAYVLGKQTFGFSDTSYGKRAAAELVNLYLGKGAAQVKAALRNGNMDLALGLMRQGLAEHMVGQEGQELIEHFHPGSNSEYKKAWASAAHAEYKKSY